MPMLENVKFLLVDDIQENLVALAALLKRDGLELHTARSGVEALELVLEHDFALAFIDVQMPEMNGFELAELLRGAERSKHLPIIFLTAGVRDERRVFAGYETGAVDFLFKPLEPVIIQGKADVFFQLHRRRQELMQALRLNEMFVGILGHDLRNPLGTIITGARALRHQLQDERHLRSLERMSNASGRMVRMIDQLLDLTRARSGGGIQLKRERLQLGDLVHRVVDELRDAYPQREIHTRIEDDTQLIGDTDRLLQVLSNLIGNALVHGTAETPVEVVVTCGDDVRLSVQNHGQVPPALLSVLFDPFRGTHNASQGTRGLGLGLFISRQIARAHGGDITVTSTEAEGTCFEVRLPRGSRHGEDGPRTWVATPEPPAPRAKPRVLIVEDLEEILETLQETFLDEGWEVSTATTGTRAMELLGCEFAPPDAMVLDLGLPDVSGNEIYARLQADPRLATIPVVVATAEPGQAPEGALVVRKPYDAQRLINLVSQISRDAKGA